MWKNTYEIKGHKELFTCRANSTHRFIKLKKIVPAKFRAQMTQRFVKK